MVYQMLDRRCAADQRAFHGISANLEYGDYAPRAKGCYETPYDGGPQYGSGGGDQFGYGPGYSVQTRSGRL